LTDSQPVNPGWLGLKPGRGFGLGVSVVLETDKADFMRRGSVGTVSWPGAWGGWWQADPREGSVMIFLAHNMVDLAQMAKGVGLAVWDAIDRFQTLATAALAGSIKGDVKRKHFSSTARRGNFSDIQPPLAAAILFAGAWFCFPFP
jgi:CubicO group peptidase (beta-lactamase class C family)